MKREETLEGHMAPKRDETAVLSHYGRDYFNRFQKEIAVSFIDHGLSGS
jgi:hypothetical protein